MGRPLSCPGGRPRTASPNFTKPGEAGRGRLSGPAHACDNKLHENGVYTVHDGIHVRGIIAQAAFFDRANLAAPHSLPRFVDPLR